MFCSTKRASEDRWGRSAARRVPDGRGHGRMSDHARVSPAVELTVQASLSQLQVDIFEGGLARDFCFHNSTLQLLSLARDACLLWQRLCILCVLSAPSMRTNLRRHTRIVSICGAIMRHPFSFYSKNHFKTESEQTCVILIFEKAVTGCLGKWLQVAATDCSHLQRLVATCRHVPS